MHRAERLRLIYDEVFAVPNPDGAGHVLVLADGRLGDGMPEQVLNLLVTVGHIRLDDDGIYRMRNVRRGTDGRTRPEPDPPRR